MWKSVLLRLVRPIRRLLGVEQIIQNQRQILNSLSIERRSQTYFDCLDIIHLLAPMDLQGASYVRLGRQYDGGYVLVEEFLERVNVAYSFGIANDMSLEEEISKYDICVLMFDHTIDIPEFSNRRLSFFNKGITGHDLIEGCSTLGSLLAENGHEHETEMILKLDVEGCEWDVLDECTSETLSRFCQIIVEYHSITPWLSRACLESLKKLNATHQCVHVHAARSSHPGTTPFVLGDLVLPRQLEVTYVRRQDVEGRLVPNTRQFPTGVDMPNFPDIADIDLGYFSPCRPFQDARPQDKN